MRSLGVDIGKKRDPAALVQVDRQFGRYHVTHCGRVPLDTAYPQVGKIISTIGKDADVVVVDAGGVGEAVIDHLPDEHKGLWRVTLTGGRTTKINHQARIASVPKAALVGRIMTLLSSRWMIMDVGADHASKRNADAMVEEMRRFKAKQNPNGYISLSAQHGFYDDLVISLGLALLGFKLAEVHG